jgi:hypothetical protein
MFTLVYRSDDTYDLYVNGVSRATGTQSLGSRTGSSSIIGGLQTGLGSFNATADFAEFAAWGRALSGAEVASLYTGAEAGLPATSVATPIVYAPLLGSASPEPETVGGSSWTVNGSMAASTTTGGSPAHPIISAGATTSRRNRIVRTADRIRQSFKKNRLTQTFTSGVDTQVESNASQPAGGSGPQKEKYWWFFRRRR